MKVSSILETRAIIRLSFLLFSSQLLDLLLGERYSPNNSEDWQEVTEMFSPRSNFATVILDDMIFVVGGFNGESVSRSTHRRSTSMIEMKSRVVTRYYHYRLRRVLRCGQQRVVRRFANESQSKCTQCLRYIGSL